MVGIIEEFANRYSKPSQLSTKRGYKSTLKEYFNINNKKPNKSYFKQTQIQFIKDIEKFFQSLQQEREIPIFKTGKTKKVINTPSSIKIKLSRVKHFLARNNISIPLDDWEDWKRRNKGHSKPTSRKLTFQPDELRSVLQNANQMYTALFLTLSSSGMRIKEALQLYEDDLHLDTEPPSIDIQADYTKTGIGRIVYITKEAKEEMEKWKDNRDKYLDVIFNRISKNSIIKKNRNDDRVFPIGYAAARNYWERLLKKADKDIKDKRTKIYCYNIHSLRRYFRNHLKIDKEYREALLGHTMDKGLGYFDRELNEPEIKRQFLDKSHQLQVFNRGTPQELVKQLENEIKRRDKQIDNKDGETKDLLNKWGQLTKDEIDKIETDFQHREEKYLDKIKELQNELKGKKKPKEEIDIDEITKKVIEKIKKSKKKDK